MPTLSEDDTDESDGNWQQVGEKACKRRTTKSPKMHLHKKINLTQEPSTSRANKFQILDVEEDANLEDMETDDNATPKPPPIFIPDVENINLMTKSILKIIPSSDFSYKSMRDSQVRLMIKNIDSYRKVVKYLESKKISFHTYQLKQERAYRVVIKGLHHTTPVDDIKAQLILLGHQVRSVYNIKSKISKNPLPMFFVDVDPNPNNKEIYNIKSINNAIITVEPPKKEYDLVQCFRCQQFGHTKTYCKKAFRCVKCGNDHPTAECKKDINTPPSCVHCSLNHTANYKGCRVYQELVQKRQSTNVRYTPAAQGFQVNSRDFPQSSSQPKSFVNANETEHISYSQAVRGNIGSNDINILSKMEAMLEKLMSLMTVIITKLCK